MKSKKDFMPHIVHPQLATLVDKAPVGEEWLHEIKLDGYRLICFISNTSVKLVTRNQIDFSSKVPLLIAAIKKLKLGRTILDGELVAINKNNKSDFQLLQNFLKETERAQLRYFIFDIIYHDGKDLSLLPLFERKKILKKLLHTKKSNSIHYNDHVIGHGDLIFKKSCELGLEGIISKNIHSSYEQKRTKNWQKVKCIQRQEFIICGFIKSENARGHLRALLLGVYANGKLKYCGNVGTGFSEATLSFLYPTLLKNLTKKKNFASLPRALKQVYWVKPNLIAEIEFTEWTQDGLLRHPSFKGLREDKSPKKISKENKFNA